LAEEQLTESVREALVGAGAVREVKMFGGIGFILNGNLAVAASKRGLLARVGRERQDDALARAAARPMVTGSFKSHRSIGLRVTSTDHAAMYQ
jgi:TfoX/Sxy family transcriptional regulator of competence genes